MPPQVEDNFARLKGLKAALEVDTNFKIVIGEYQWDVHEDVLVSQSSFFKALIQGPWSESRCKSVSLAGEDVWMVARMIQFFYGETFAWSHDAALPVRKPTFYMEEYVRRVATSTETLPDLNTLMKPFCKTQDYELLRNQDKERTETEKFGCMYVLADKYGCEELRSHILRKFDTFTPAPASLPKAFSGVFGDLVETDTQLRAIVASHLARCYKELRAVKRTSDWLELWLASDIELAMLVMDRMTPIEKRGDVLAASVTAPIRTPTSAATILGPDKSLHPRQVRSSGVVSRRIYDRSRRIDYHRRRLRNI